MTRIATTSHVDRRIRTTGRQSFRVFVNRAENVALRRTWKSYLLASMAALAFVYVSEEDIPS